MMKINTRDCKCAKDVKNLFLEEHEDLGKTKQHVPVRSPEI